MKVDLRKITIREVAENYRDNAEDGVVGYNGKLNIRPKYQREFIYNAKQRDAVLMTIRKGFPLNVMYWAANGDGTYEILDGQQRTISFCQYVAGDFSLDAEGRLMAMHNLTQPQKDQILSYELMVYVCEGNEQEKLDWFKTINIAGVKLTEQELRNAVYTGPWLSHAKSVFSRTNGPAYGLSNKFVSSVPNRQELLEIALDWKSSDNIEQYMSDHQHDPNANELWTYFQNVIRWVELTFTTPRKEMKSVKWGPLFDEFGGKLMDTANLDKQIARMMADEDITKKPGIYAYVFNCKESHLNIRSFTDNMKREAYERQNGICVKCNQHFEPGEMEGDHITPWREGGRTNALNLQMLCKDDNRRKSDT